ncbi:MAG: membrane protein insertase YidC [Myxococcaceae bacterium]
MDSQRRLLLAIALSFAVTVLYMMVNPPVPPPEAQPAAAPSANAPKVAAPTPTPLPAGTPSAAAPAAPVAVAETASVPVKRVTLTRDTSRYVWNSQGASLAEALLLGEKTKEQERVTLREAFERFTGRKEAVSKAMNLSVPLAGRPPPLSTAIEGPVPFAADAAFEVLEETPQSIRFRAAQQGWEVIKEFRWPKEGYELLMTLTVRNTTQEARTGELWLHTTREVDPSTEEAPSFFGGVGNQASAACAVGEELEKRAPSDDPPETLKGPIRFFGVDHQYFLAAVFPLSPSEGRCVFVASPKERAASAAFALSLAPGESHTSRYGIYLGPKDVDALAGVPSSALLAVGAQPVTAPAPQLERTVDFGIWTVLCKALLWSMKKFYALAGNWGVAIILLTVLVKLVLFPLTHRSMVGMEAMKKLQPQVETIRKKFVNDRERQQMETMKLYQQAKVNPFGSCMLMLVQMPVWIALYTTLRTSYELYREPLVGPVWLDLTYKDPTYLFPILLGVTMVLTAKLQPPAADPVQQKMFTWFMPIFFSAVLLATPSGLTLYMLTNNILSIGQTYALRRWLDRRAGAGPAVPQVLVEKRK